MLPDILCVTCHAVLNVLLGLGGYYESSLFTSTFYAGKKNLKRCQNPGLLIPFTWRHVSMAFIPLAVECNQFVGGAGRGDLGTP